MRKKLLALLMCATMVLGSSVVASADTASSVTTANSIISNGSKVTAEVEYPTAPVKVVKYVPGEGAVYYGFDTNNNLKALRLNGTSNTDYLNLLDEVDINVAKKNNPSVGTVDVARDGLKEYVAEQAVANKASLSLDSSNKTKTDVTVLVVGHDDYSSTTYHTYIVTIPEGTDLSSATSAITSFSTTNITAKQIATKSTPEFDATTKLLKADVVYRTADGYGYDATKSTNLLYALSATEDSDASSFAYTLTSFTASGDATAAAAIANAVNEGTLSKNAVAVKLTVYQYGLKNDVPYCEIVNLGSAPFSLKVQNDILSRTGLDKTTTDVYTVSNVYVNTTDFGTVYKLTSVASGLDFSTAYSTFTLPVSYVLGNRSVLIFDQGAATSNNDGVSTDNTTAAPAADKTTSYTTGDVAPIAALAIVMMGAFGAMVVASKKRV